MGRSKPPIKKKYIESPEKLWELFQQYVEFEKQNPMHRRDYVGKDGEEKDTPLLVPITFIGFECWLQDNDIIENLSNYETNKDNSYDSYQPIITRIKNNCYNQNFKGAAVGLFNASLIARKLGLIEKTETEVTVKTPPIDTSKLSDNTLDELINAATEEHK